MPIDKKLIQNQMLKDQYVALMRRGVPETDPRVKAIVRIMERDEVALPRKGRDFPEGIKFTPPRKQHGLS